MLYICLKSIFGQESLRYLMYVRNFPSRNEIIMNDCWFLFTTADEFLICYAARDSSVSLRSVSRYGSTKERKYWFEYEENLLHRAYFGYGSISEMWRKKFQKLSILLSIRPQEPQRWTSPTTSTNNVTIRDRKRTLSRTFLDAPDERPKHRELRLFHYK